MPPKRYLRDKNKKLARPNMKKTGRSVRISVGMGNATSAILIRENGKVQRTKSRSVLFQYTSRFGASARKVLEQEVSPDNLQEYGFKEVIRLPYNFLQQQSMDIQRGQNSQKDMKRVEQLLQVFGNQRDTIRKSILQNIQNIDPNVDLDLEQFELVFYKVSADKFGQEFDSVMSSNQWYKAHYFELFNEHQMATVNPPMAKYKRDDPQGNKMIDRFFLPYMTASFGKNSKVKIEVTDDLLTKFVDDTEELPTIDTTSFQSDEQKSKLKSLFGNSVQLSIPYCRTVKQMVDRMATYEQLVEHSKAKGIQEIFTKEAYDEFVRLAKIEALNLNKYPVWDTVSRTIPYVEFKEEIWIVNCLPKNIMEINGFTQKIQMKRKVEWFKRKESLIVDNLKTYQTGLIRYEDFEEKDNILEQEVKVNRPDGVKMLKMNRYSRFSLYTNIELYELKRHVFRHPLAKYAMAFFGILDIDDVKLRIQISNIVFNRSMTVGQFIQTLAPVFKYNKISEWRTMSQTDKETLKKTKEDMINPKSIRAIQRRFNGFTNAITKLSKTFNGLITDGIPSESRFANNQYFQRFAHISPYAVFLSHVKIIYGMTSIEPEDDDIMIPQMVGGMKRTGLNRGLAGVLRRILFSQDSGVQQGSPSMAKVINILLSYHEFSLPNRNLTVIKTMCSQDDIDLSLYIGALNSNNLVLDELSQKRLGVALPFLLELLETFSCVVALYQSQQFKGISDINLWAYIACFKQFIYMLCPALDVFVTGMSTQQDIDSTQYLASLLADGEQLVVNNYVGAGVQTDLQFFTNMVFDNTDLMKYLRVPRKADYSTPSMFFTWIRYEDQQVRQPHFADAEQTILSAIEKLSYMGEAPGQYNQRYVALIKTSGETINSKKGVDMTRFMQLSQQHQSALELQRNPQFVEILTAFNSVAGQKSYFTQAQLVYRAKRKGVSQEDIYQLAYKVYQVVKAVGLDPQLVMKRAIEARGDINQALTFNGIRKLRYEVIKQVKNNIDYVTNAGTLAETRAGLGQRYFRGQIPVIQSEISSNMLAAPNLLTAMQNTITTFPNQTAKLNILLANFRQILAHPNVVSNTTTLQWLTYVLPVFFLYHTTLQGSNLSIQHIRLAVVQAERTQADNVQEEDFKAMVREAIRQREEQLGQQTAAQNRQQQATANQQQDPLDDDLANIFAMNEEASQFMEEDDQ